MPPHLYGELTRTAEGCTIMAKRKIVSDLLTRVRRLHSTVTQQSPSLSSGGAASPRNSVPAVPPMPVPTQEISSANRAVAAAMLNDFQGVLWALGHIASNEFGMTMILDVDRRFIAWCVENACNCSFYSLRGTYFFVLGLISRSPLGRRKLLTLGWDSAPRNGNSAVAYPLHPSSLFRGGAMVPSDYLRSRMTGSPDVANKKTLFNAAAAVAAISGGSVTLSSIGGSSVSGGGAGGGGAGGGGARSDSATRSLATLPGWVPGTVVPKRQTSLPPAVLNSLGIVRPVNGAAKNAELEVLTLISRVRLVYSILYLSLHLSIAFVLVVVVVVVVVVVITWYMLPSDDCFHFLNDNVFVDVYSVVQLPGVIVYRECKMRIESIKKENPQLFTSKKFYRLVNLMLESYTFKLTARRDILALFSEEAKLNA
jgi:hypothetical protein